MQGDGQVILKIQNLHMTKQNTYVDIGLVEKPFQHTCLYHLQDCVVNGDYLAI